MQIPMWIGFISSFLLGPIRLPDHPDSNSCLYFLQNPLELFDDLPVILRNHLFYAEHLNDHYPDT